MQKRRTRKEEDGACFSSQSYGTGESSRGDLRSWLNRLLSSRGRKRPFVLSESLLAYILSRQNLARLTAHDPATLAHIAELIAICLVPLVLLNSAPLNAPATTLLLVLCLPR
jgi:hypothetical protein